MLVARNTRYEHKRTFMMENPGLFWHGDMEPKHWGPWGMYHFPNRAEESRVHLANLIAYAQSHPEQNILMEIWSEKEYYQKYLKARSVYSPRRH